MVSKTGFCALLFVLLSGSTAFAAGFKLKSVLPADSGVRSVALADLNHDGKLDLAVASYLSDNTVSVQLGNGDGTFQPVIRYGVGTQPYAVAASDLNLDGNLDLVVANELDDSVSVLLGNGDGTFQSQMVYSTGDQPVDLALGDVNGDGIPDIAVASIGVAILLGNGDGTFQPYSDVFSPGAYSVAFADLNNDGRLDLAIGTSLGSAGQVQILLGKGEGSFQTGGNYSLQTATPYSIVAGDLNHDGAPDLAVTTFFLGIDVLIGHGNGSFRPPVSYSTPSSSYGIATADFNRDSNLDIAAGDFDSTSYVSVFSGKGDGTFSPAVNYLTGSGNADSVASGDLNGDGSPDLVVGHDTVTVSILLNTGGTFIQTISSSNPSRVGQSVTFSVQVKQSVPGTGVPTGTVTFKDGQRSAKATLVNGVARFTTSKLTQGAHTITAAYSGDINFNRNTAKPLLQVVNP